MGSQLSVEGFSSCLNCLYPDLRKVKRLPHSLQSNARVKISSTRLVSLTTLTTHLSEISVKEVKGHCNSIMQKTALHVRQIETKRIPGSSFPQKDTLKVCEPRQHIAQTRYTDPQRPRYPRVERTSFPNTHQAHFRCNEALCTGDAMMELDERVDFDALMMQDPFQSPVSWRAEISTPGWPKLVEVNQPVANIVISVWKYNEQHGGIPLSEVACYLTPLDHEGNMIPLEASPLKEGWVLGEPMESTFPLMREFRFRNVTFRQPGDYYFAVVVVDLEAVVIARCAVGPEGTGRPGFRVHL